MILGYSSPSSSFLHSLGLILGFLWLGAASGASNPPVWLLTVSVSWPFCSRRACQRLIAACIHRTAPAVRTLPRSWRIYMWYGCDRVYFGWLFFVWFFGGQKREEEKCFAFIRDGWIGLVFRGKRSARSFCNVMYFEGTILDRVSFFRE